MPWVSFLGDKMCLQNRTFTVRQNVLSGGLIAVFALPSVDQYLCSEIVSGVFILHTTHIHLCG